MQYCHNLKGRHYEKIGPIGYSKSSLGTSVAIIIAVGSAFIIFAMVKSGASFSDVKYIAIVAAILAVLFFIGDIIINRKNAEKIKRMEYLLSCPSAKGEVIELKKYLIFLEKKLQRCPKQK